MRKAALERQEMDRFARYWERLYQALPDARRQAAQAMGAAVKKDLNVQIQAADLESSAKGSVRSWQAARIGSKGGYAAVSPIKGTVWSKDRRSGGWKMRQHTYKGKPVTAKQVTRWLERGHGTPAGGYVKGRQFYSFTRAKAWEHARKAADKVLSAIADEVDF